MNTNTRAIIASIVVITLCLAAVGGVTYSWFSDTEEAEINVSTAKVDISIDDITVGTVSGIIDPVSDIDVDMDTYSVAITNLAARCTVPMTITVDNDSSIQIIYMAYALIEDTTTDDPETLDKVLINNQKLSSASDVEGETLKGIPLLTEWTQTTDSTFTISVTLSSLKSYGTIGNTVGDFTVTDEWASESRDIDIKFVVYAYQGDYDEYATVNIMATETTATTSTFQMTSASVTDEASSIKATGSATTSTQTVSYTVELSQEVTSSVATVTEASEDNWVKLIVDVEDSGSSTFEVAGTAVDVSLIDQDNQKVDFSGGYADITVVVPGQITSPTVLYTGDGDDQSQPTIIASSINTADNTTSITFRTTHFSNFLVMDSTDGVATINGIIYPSIDSALSAAKTGDTIVLLKDVTMADDTALDITKSVTISGNGHKILFDHTHGIRIASSNIAVTLKELTVKAKDNGILGRAVQINEDITNIDLDIYKCDLTASTYCLNILWGSSAHDIDIQYSSLTGYAAINDWSDGSEVTIIGSTLTGVNSYSGESNSFMTIALEAWTSMSGTDHAANSVYEITNSTIASTATGTAKQYLIGFNGYGTDVSPQPEDTTTYSAQGISIVVDDCILAPASTDYMYLNDGKNNNLAVNDEIIFATVITTADELNAAKNTHGVYFVKGDIVLTSSMTFTPNGGQVLRFIGVDDADGNKASITFNNAGRSLFTGGNDKELIVEFDNIELNFNWTASDVFNTYKDYRGINPLGATLYLNGCDINTTNAYVAVEVRSEKSSNLTMIDCKMTGTGSIWAGVYIRNNGNINIMGCEFSGYPVNIPVDTTAGFDSLTVYANTFHLDTPTTMENPSWNADHDGKPMALSFMIYNKTYTEENLIVYGNTFIDEYASGDVTIFGTASYDPNGTNTAYTADNINTIREIINSGSNYLKTDAGDLVDVENAYYSYRVAKHQALWADPTPLMSEAAVLQATE